MPATPRAVPAILFAVLSLGACEASIPVGPATSVPVVQAMLVLEDSSQTAWVEWRLPADSTATGEVRPVPAALVQLWLIKPTGDSVPFDAVAGTPGRFDAVTAVTPGATYALRGTVAAQGLSAVTTVPGPLVIQAPASDTTVVAGACFFCELPYRWFAQGTDTYLVTDGTGGEVAIQDTAGMLQVRHLSDTMTVSVFALDTHAAAFFVPANPKSSINGVFGLFGAASRAGRVVVFQ